MKITLVQRVQFRVSGGIASLRQCQQNCMAGLARVKPRLPRLAENASQPDGAVTAECDSRTSCDV
jgi:hypothetical protein